MSAALCGGHTAAGAVVYDVHTTSLSFCRAMLCVSAAYRVVRCLSVTFVYCVKTAKDTAIAAMQFE